MTASVPKSYYQSDLATHVRMRRRRRRRRRVSIKGVEAATVVRQHASPRSYLVDVGGRRIRRNRLVLRTDSSRSHDGFWKRHANTIPQPEPDPGNAHVVPMVDKHTHDKYSRGSPPRSSSSSGKFNSGCTTLIWLRGCQGLSPVHNSEWVTGQETSQATLVT